MVEKPRNEKTLQLKYFIDNKIINSNPSISISEHYLSLPFKIFSLLFKSFTEDCINILLGLGITHIITFTSFHKKVLKSYLG